jgi:hypothetical protein
MLQVIEADRINPPAAAFNVWFRVPVHSSRVQIQGSPFSSQENLDSPVSRTANPEF